MTNAQVQERLQQVLVQLLPTNGSTVSNRQLLTRWMQAAAAAGPKASEHDFTTVREVA